MDLNQNPDIVENLSWDRVAERIAKGAIAILPIGAAAKEHGFHLPMNTDRIQAELLALRISAFTDALIWPTVTYGYYPAFEEYPGSGSLSLKTFESMIEELTFGLLDKGCRAVLILDTGISTIMPIDRALARLLNRNVLHLKIHDGPRYRTAVEKYAEQSYGSHADEVETSLMLVFAPHRVDMNRAQASPSAAREVKESLTPFDPLSPGYSRSGSFGDPTLATPGKGQAIFAAMVDDLAEQVRDFVVGLTDLGNGKAGS